MPLMKQILEDAEEHMVRNHGTPIEPRCHGSEELATLVTLVGVGVLAWVLFA